MIAYTTTVQYSTLFKEFPYSIRQNQSADSIETRKLQLIYCALWRQLSSTNLNSEVTLAFYKSDEGQFSLLHVPIEGPAVLSNTPFLLNKNQ